MQKSLCQISTLTDHYYASCVHIGQSGQPKVQQPRVRTDDGTPKGI